MSRFVVLVAMLLCFGLSSQNSDASNCSDDKYEHNGSEVAVLICSTGVVDISCLVPRVDIKSHGVRSGTVLFDGAWQNGLIRGQARLFSNRCGESLYSVAGSMVGNTRHDPPAHSRNIAGVHLTVCRVPACLDAELELPQHGS